MGAQVDVSGLARDSYGLGALKRLVDETGDENQAPEADEFTRLAEILGPRELDTVRERGGDMHRPTGPRRHERRGSSKSNTDHAGDHGGNGARHRVVLREADSPTEPSPRSGPSSRAASLAQHSGRLTGVYENYLLVRPYPSLRILFTSPSMRMPGILQSPLLDRIGGSARMRDQFVHALAGGQGVTAKVKWLSVSHKVATYGSRPPRKKMQYNHPLEAHLDVDDDDDTLAEPEPAGRQRWLHCTPLMGSNGKVGVWMIVIVDDEPEPNGHMPNPGLAGHMPMPHMPMPGPRRSETPASGAPEDAGDPLNGGYISEGRLSVRTRKSSETLGSAPANKEQDASATKSIHHQHSATATRAPKPSLRSTSVPARFFHTAALSRASLASASSNETSVSLFDAGQQLRESNKGGAPSRVEVRSETRNRVEVRSETPMPAWPLPPDSSMYTRRKREHQIYVPPAIQESSERGITRSHDDEETASTRSRASAFTVRIDENQL